MFPCQEFSRVCFILILLEESRQLTHKKVVNSKNNKFG